MFGIWKKRGKVNHLPKLNKLIPLFLGFLLWKWTSQNGNLKKVTAYFSFKPLSGKKRVRLSAVVMKPQDPRKPSTEKEGCCALHFLSGPVLGQEAWLLPSPWPQLPGRPRSGSSCPTSPQVWFTTSHSFPRDPLLLPTWARPLFLPPEDALELRNKLQFTVSNKMTSLRAPSMHWHLSIYPAATLSPAAWMLSLISIAA